MKHIYIKPDLRMKQRYRLSVWLSKSTKYIFLDHLWTPLLRHALVTYPMVYIFIIENDRKKEEKEEKSSMAMPSL
jgi:hypothetical protein